MPDTIRDNPPDYTTMTGAQFQRAVGADPEKWAEAFMQHATSITTGSHEDGSLKVYAAKMMHEAHTREERVAYVTGWFRDFAEAVLKEHPPLP